jgi:cytochrome c oxidase subunit 2
MDKKSYRRHFIIAGAIVAVVTVLAVLGLANIRWMAEPASTQAGPIDSLLAVELVAIGFLFALVMVFMLYSLVVFRRRNGEETDGDHFEGNTKLEVVWTIIPLITVLALAVLGARGLTEATSAQEGERIVEVSGFSFGFQFAYPDLGIEASPVLYLPVNQPVLLKLRSINTDVIHDFWVPEFRVKQDLVPGVPTELRITPNRIGEFKVICDELCGTGHTFMNAPVRVVSQADFDAWAAEQLPTSDPAEMAALGQELTTAQGCTACHNITGDAGGVGPTWKGLFGSERTFEDGATATADEAYLHESIVDPMAHIVQDYAPAMPQTYGEVFSDTQIAYIIEYIKTLQ